MCTDFSIKAIDADYNKKVPVIGRSMELGPDLKSELFFRAKNYSYTQGAAKKLVPSSTQDKSAKFLIRTDITQINEKLHSWKGKYGFVAMNGFEQKIVDVFKPQHLSSLLANIATNGLNTEGLTSGTMVLAQSEYQSPLDENGELIADNSIIYYPSITTWILSNCATCQDVIDGLRYDKLVINKGGSTLKESETNSKDKIIVVNPFSKLPNAMKFHFPVHDASGNSIVLEYVNGNLTITDLNPIGVLTNDPVIGWQQENVSYNYVNVVPFNFQNEEGEPAVPNEAVYKRAAQNFQCNSYAQGTGFSGVPGSSTPVDRFVRAAMMTNFSFPVFQLLDQNEIQETNKFKTNVTGYANLNKQTPPIDFNIEVGKEDATTLAFHILNTVDIPLGTSQDSQGKNVHDFTQWATVSDLINKTFSIRMYQSPQVFSINLMDLDLEQLKNYIYTLDTNQKSINITDNINKKQHDEVDVQLGAMKSLSSKESSVM